MNDKMTDQEFATDLKNKLFRSVGYGSSDTESDDRINAMKYYFQRPRGDEVEGASRVVSGDLSAMVEATLSQMTEAFATDSIAEFLAFDKEDEHQARLESEAVQYQIMVANNGIMQFIPAIKEALLFRLGVIKVWAEEEEISKIKSYVNVEKEALAAFAPDNLPPNVEIHLLEYDSENKTAKVKQITKRRKLKIRSLPVENFLYIETESTGNDVQELPFVAERYITTRSDMILKGFEKDLVYKLPKMVHGRTRETSARSPGGIVDTLNTGLDKSQDLIEWFEIYVMADRDNDGIAERWKISFHPEGLNNILREEPVEVVPYAVGSVLINPHKIRGISLYDKLRQVQDINTGLYRSLLDNATVVNQGRLAYLDGKVNTEDLDSRRPDRSIRVGPGVQNINDVITAITVPDLSSGIQQNINDQRQVRSEMGGSALEMASANIRMGERVGSQGIDRAYSVMEQLSAMMCLIITQTLIKSVFVLTHETMRKNFTQQEVIFKKAGRWNEVNPALWPKREGVNLKIAKSPMERTRRTQALSSVLGIQTQMAQMGMDEILVNLDGFHHALIDYARAMDLPNPEKYFIDPTDPTSIKARKLKAQSAQQQIEMENRFLQQAVQLQQLQTAFSKYKQDTDLQFKYWKEVLDSEIKEAEIVGNATTNLLLKKMGMREIKNKEGSSQDTLSESGNNEEGSPADIE